MSKRMNWMPATARVLGLANPVLELALGPHTKVDVVCGWKSFPKRLIPLAD